MISTDWMTLESGERLLGICKDGIPLILPNDYLLQVFENSHSAVTSRTYASRLVIFYKWLFQSKITLEQLTRHDLTEFKTALFTKQKISQSTKQQTIGCPIRYLEWLLEPDDDDPIFNPKSKQRQRANRGMLKGIVNSGVKKVKSSLTSSF